MHKERRSIQLGDVFELETPKGLAYLQYAYYDPQMGELIRVAPGTYGTRPANLATVIAGCEIFYTFFPLATALKQKIIRRISNYEIPVHVARPPVLRSPGRVNMTSKRIENWWLWDGVRSWPVNELTEEQKKLSVKAIWNDTLLVDRIVNGWRPSDYE